MGKQKKAVPFGYYDGLQQMTDFKVLPKQKYRVVGTDKSSEQYRLQVIFEDQKSLELEVSAEELNSGRWLNMFPVSRYVSDEKLVQKSLLPGLSAAYRRQTYAGILMERGGMRSLASEWYYVTPGGSIGKEGIVAEISVLSGNENKKIWKELFDIYASLSMQMECECFLKTILQADAPMYMAFLAAVMAMNVLPLSQQGIFASLTFWLGGDSGSGKTELAKNMTGIEMMGGALISATGRIRELVNTLAGSSGNVVVLDDVKKERDQRQRDKSRTAVDICLRSVYQRRVTEETAQTKGRTDVYTCAVITGEFLENSESQNARLVYVESSAFLEKQENSLALQDIQEAPWRVVMVLLKYAEWFCGYLEENELERLKAKYDTLRHDAREQITGKNAMRLADSKAALQLGTFLFQLFLRDVKVEEELMNRFSRKTQMWLDTAMVDTAILVSGYRLLLGEVLCSIIQKADENDKLRISKYQVHGGDQLVQEEFCFQASDALLYIADLKKSLEDETGAKKMKNGKPMLIARKDWLWEQIEERLSVLVDQKRIPPWFQSKVSFVTFAEEALIFGKKRADYGFRYTGLYPEILEEEQVEDWGNEPYMKRSLLETTAIAVNLENECFQSVRRDLAERADVEVESVQYFRPVRKFQLSYDSDKARKMRAAFLSEVGRI